MEQKIEGSRDSWSYYLSRQQRFHRGAFGLHDGYSQGCLLQHKGIVFAIADGH